MTMESCQLRRSKIDFYGLYQRDETLVTIVCYRFFLVRWANQDIQYFAYIKI